jgi:hypothetical protein
MAASIGEWGWTNPVLVDEAGTIIAGHGRVLAARKLHISDVPVMIAAGWTDAQKRAFGLRRLTIIIARETPDEFQSPNALQVRLCRDRLGNANIVAGQTTAAF